MNNDLFNYKQVYSLSKYHILFTYFLSNVKDRSKTLADILIESTLIRDLFILLSALRMSLEGICVRVMICHSEKIKFSPILF